MKIPLVFAIALAATAAQVSAEVGFKVAGKGAGAGNQSIVDVRVDGVTAIASDGGDASVTIGGIEGDAEIQGVTVINDRVWIDGKEVPAKVTRYKSPKTGTVYRIERKRGSVSVTTEDGGGK